MNTNAIVYTSNTGYTAQYAKLLGKKTGLPLYSLAEAGAKLIVIGRAGEEVGAGFGEIVHLLREEFSHAES